MLTRKVNDRLQTAPGFSGLVTVPRNCTKHRIKDDERHVSNAFDLIGKHWHIRRRVKRLPPAVGILSRDEVAHS